MIIDLSQPIETGAPAWVEMGGTFGLAKTIVSTWEDYDTTAYLRTHGRESELFRTCFILMSDNGGTHVDSIYHFDPLGERIAEVPLERFYGDAVLLDLTALRPIRYDPYAKEIVETDWITPEAIEEALDKAGEEIRPDDIVLFRTGAERVWPNKEYHFTFVPFRLEAVNWMIDRGVKLFGMDQITIDVIPGYDLPHMNMRKRYSMHMENLRNLDKITKPRFRFAGFPLKWEGGPCSPIRAMAIVD
ncbi:MAG: cyclase family protein [bacterium]